MELLTLEDTIPWFARTRRLIFTKQMLDQDNCKDALYWNKHKKQWYKKYCLSI